MTTKTLLLAWAIAAGPLLWAQSATRFDVVITEIMADPTPVIGLPNAEFIEIKNTSTIPFNLLGWRLSDATSTATINTPFILLPDSLVILCANNQVAAFASFGRTIGVTAFPSLDNEGDLIILRSSQNRIVHAIAYTSDWYGNEVKKNGGWSLEIVDPTYPCGGSGNWKASIHSQGGTPGRGNSVNAVNRDQDPPQLKRTYAIDSVTLVAVFNEPLDSATAAVAGNYTLTGTPVAEALPIAPLYQSVRLKTSSPMLLQQVYNLQVQHVTDCKGNKMGAFNTAKAGIAQTAGSTDLIINEILFNPRSGENDYVEFFNRSKKIIDASTLYIANRNSGGNLTSIQQFSEEPFPVFPGDYLVLTEDRSSLQKGYLVKNQDAVLVLSSLPSFPDDKGTVALLNKSGDVLDEVSYHQNWHFALIDNSEGVSLERINPDAPSQNKSSWHSAAATAGYGTPTYQNSQNANRQPVPATLAVAPAVFSPDNDGRDDLATISYQLAERGYVANVTIFDAGGRLVRYLVKNELLAQKGFWTWDGLGEQRQKLPVGTYIVFTEMFNLEGKKKTFKHAIVLVRPLQ